MYCYDLKGACYPSGFVVLLLLTGIAIGIFCIVAVLAVLNSMERKIHDRMAALGSDVLYINRMPWVMQGEFKWWEYLQRRPMGLYELRGIVQSVPGISVATLSYNKREVDLKADNNEVKGIVLHGVTPGFDKVQNVEIAQGRYFTQAELESGSDNIVVGSDVNEALFAGRTAVGKTVHLSGRGFHIVGVMRKQGQNVSGINFDEAVIIAYPTAVGLYNMQSVDLNNDPLLMVKAAKGMPTAELKDEVTGTLRRLRKVAPGGKDNFSINELAQISEAIGSVFGIINTVGMVIGGFSLVVGAFGIANIMFVTVRERRKVIGLKKAIGAPRTVILTEFLTEAVTLCLIGGAIGILLVLLLSLLLTYGFDFRIMLSVSNVVFGVGISAIVGTVAGIIPALSAARLDPVVAIRST